MFNENIDWLRDRLDIAVKCCNCLCKPSAKKVLSLNKGNNGEMHLIALG